MKRKKPRVTRKKPRASLSDRAYDIYHKRFIRDDQTVREMYPYVIAEHMFEAGYRAAMRDLRRGKK